MRRSSERILTTHAGSLPRPANLTDLFVRRARGESFDADAIAAAGLAAVRAIVPHRSFRRGRGRRQQRRAAARFVLPLSQGTAHRSWRELAAAVTRGCRTLSRVQEAVDPADFERGTGVAQRGPAYGPRRGALYRCGSDRERMP